MDKAFHIKFGSIDDFGDAARRSLQGKGDPLDVGCSAMFENLNEFMSYMFPSKFTLLMMISAKRPKSIYELAKHAGLAQSGVLKDCKELESMRFITLKQGGSRNAMVPALAFNYDRLVVHATDGDSAHILPQPSVAA